MAIARHRAHEELECRGVAKAGREIALQHRKLVEIGQKDVRLHRRPARASSFSSSWTSAPRRRISSSARAPSPGRASTAQTASERTVTWYPFEIASRTV